MMKKTIILAQLVIVLGMCLPSVPVSAITLDPNSLYLGGYLYMGMARVDPTTGAFIENVTTMDMRPMGAAFASDGELWVSDMGWDSIKRFDETGLVGENADGGDDPKRIVFGPDGNVYVAEIYNGVIAKYNGTTGAYMVVFVDVLATVADSWRSPCLAFAPDANLLVGVCTNDGASNYTSIWKYNGTTGALIGKFADVGGAGDYTIEDMDVGRGNELAVSDMYGNKVHRFNATTGVLNNTVTGFTRPTGLDYSPDGTLYVGSNYDPFTGCSLFTM